MQTHRLGIKIFAEDADDLDLLDLIPVFHRWIQTRAVEDLLVDVADYSHVTDGPGILLIAHEGNYGFDESDGRRGVVYYSKRPSGDDFETVLSTVARKAVKASQRLAAEKSLAGGIRFPGNEIELFVNDRLAASNNDEGYRELEPLVHRFAERLFGRNGYRLERNGAGDGRERLGVRILVDEPPALDTLAERFAA